MESSLKKDLKTTDSAQEKIQAVREDRGAEQLTPTSREEIIRKTEEMRRMIADTEQRQQQEGEQRAQSFTKDEAAVVRLTTVFTGLSSLGEKIRQEETDLAHLMELRDARTISALQKQLEAVEEGLRSSHSHETTAPHRPEEELIETSKELLPDIKQETAARLEHLGIEKPDMNATPQDMRSKTPPTIENKEELKDTIDKDPRYEAIAIELTNERAKEYARITRKPVSNQDLKIRRDEDGSIWAPVTPFGLHEEFAKRYPEDYKKYLEKEKTRVYKGMPPEDDPAYSRALQKIHKTEREIFPFEDGIRVDWPGLKEKFEPLKERILDEFVNEYPVKAAAYSQLREDIRAALKRHELQQRASTSESRGTPPKEQLDVVVKSKSNETAPFPADRLHWTEEDFERHHQEMKSIPCIRGPEAYRNVTGTISKLVDYYEQKPGTFWQESVQPFEPRQVIMRYGGEDWSYAFHTQPKYGGSADTQESSVTGIAKKIVQKIPHLVQEYTKEINAAAPEQRPTLEHELVVKAEDVFSEMYYPDQRLGNVAVEKIEGPRGPVYITQDGNHRIAAARLIDLKRIRGIIKEPKEKSITKEFWYELLAMLPADQSHELQELYSTVYPADANAQKEDQEELQAARKKLPEIQSVLVQKEAARRAERERQDEIETIERQQAKERYDFVDHAYSSLEDAPGFQDTLHQEGLRYLWNHPNGHMNEEYVEEIDPAGWIKRKDGGMAHVLGIDLDGYPLRTEDEIKFRAIKKYAEEHPEIHIKV